MRIEERTVLFEMNAKRFFHEEKTLSKIYVLFTNELLSETLFRSTIENQFKYRGERFTTLVDTRAKLIKEATNDKPDKRVGYLKETRKRYRNTIVNFQYLRTE